MCKYYGHDIDDTKHPFLKISRWLKGRQQLETILGTITFENNIALTIIDRGNYPYPLGGGVNRQASGRIPERINVPKEQEIPINEWASNTSKP